MNLTAYKYQTVFSESEAGTTYENTLVAQLPNGGFLVGDFGESGETSLGEGLASKWSTETDTPYFTYEDEFPVFDQVVENHTETITLPVVVEAGKLFFNYSGTWFRYHDGQVFPKTPSNL